jgi:hypothetical protein
MLRQIGLWLAVCSGIILMPARGPAAQPDPTESRLNSDSNSGGQTRTGPIDFTRDVEPALTKAGCNAGACHGSFQGRGGFQLSLLGFDAAFDYDVLTKASRGRRINAGIPEQSLLLQKPTGIVPHGGGRRISVNSEVAAILKEWIADGMPGPRLDALKGLRLKVEPADLVIPLKQSGGQEGEQPAGSRSLKVTATFGEGVERDVTAWAAYDVREKLIAEVSKTGIVSAHRAGKTAVQIRYLGQVAVVGISVPYSGSGPFEFPSQNFIDELATVEWRRINAAPAPLCDDATFLRRVFLDVIGTLPTADETRRFLAESDPQKRSKTIDALLQRPEYVDYWSLRWGDLLRAHRRYLGDKGLASFSGWIRQSVRENKPLDQLARELLTAQGNLFTNGPVAYYFIDEKVEELAETTSQVFLGVRMQCTRCHHHPNEVWSQADYYGLASFFSRLETKDSGQLGSRFGGPKSLRPSAKENPNRKPLMAAIPRLFGDVIPVATAEEDPRQQLADWMTRSDNPYFARNFVNRYWSALMGRGLVEPVDDLRATNPASMPAILDALAKDFVDHHYDSKHLLRTICNSRLYQLATELNPQRDVDGQLFTHRIPRRLPAEVLLDAINQVVGTSETFVGQPPGTRAIALPDPTIASHFLSTFGRPLRNNPCDCARGSNPDLSQVLHLANSPDLHQKLVSDTGRLTQAVKGGKTDDQLVEELYYCVFGRSPSDNERQAVRESLAESKSREEGWQDVLWAMINSSEFLFNH